MPMAVNTQMQPEAWFRFSRTKSIDVAESVGFYFYYNQTQKDIEENTSTTGN